MTIAKLFRARREELGLTQEDLALAVRKSRSWIAKIEAGWRGVATIDAIAISQALKIDLKDLAAALRKEGKDGRDAKR